MSASIFGSPGVIHKDHIVHIFCQHKSCITCSQKSVTQTHHLPNSGFPQSWKVREKNVVMKSNGKSKKYQKSWKSIKFNLIRN